MFSSLNLDGSESLLRRIEREDPSGDIRRAVGIDVVATIGEPCPGSQVSSVPDEQASICRDAALRPPYWLPADLAPPTRPRRDGHPPTGSASTELAGAGRHPIEDDDGLDRTARLDAPADGWVRSPCLVSDGACRSMGRRSRRCARSAAS
jgi:hypothetical protein